MAWSTVYGPQVWESDGSLGQDYNYVVRIPGYLVAYELLSGDEYRRNNSLTGDFALYWKAGSGNASATSKSGYTTGASRTALVERIEEDGEGNFRLSLRGPSSGQSRVQSMWLGVPGTGYGFDGNQVQVKVGGSPSFVVSADELIVTDAISSSTPPPPVIEDGNMPTIEQVQSGIAQASGAYIEGQTGKHSVTQIRNPSSSGVQVYLYKIEICPDVETQIDLRSWSGSTLSVGALPTCNLFFGAGFAEAQIRKYMSDDVPWNIHSAHKPYALAPHVIKPNILLDEGRSVLIVPTVKGVGYVVNLEWLELPE